MDVVPAGLDRPLGDALLEPHRSYLDVLTPALATGHGQGARPHHRRRPARERAAGAARTASTPAIELGSWPVPPLFRLVRELATGLDAHELHRTLNMGIGMVVVCAPADVDAVQAAIAEETWVIGALVAGTGEPVVHLV